MLTLSCLKLQQQLLCKTVAMPAHRALFTSQALRAATMQSQFYMMNMRTMSSMTNNGNSTEKEGFARSTLSSPK